MLMHCSGIPIVLLTNVNSVYISRWAVQDEAPVLDCAPRRPSFPLCRIVLHATVTRTIATSYIVLAQHPVLRGPFSRYDFCN